MKSGLYFWKNSRKPSKTMGIVIALIILVLSGGAAGWYYLIYTPHKQHEEELKRKEQAIQDNILQVASFYDSNLSGGSIDRLDLLLFEIYKSRTKLSLSGYDENSVNCTTSGCTFNYAIHQGHVFSLQNKEFWGSDFSGSFSEKEVSFSDIPSKLNSNVLLDKYKANEDVNVAECGRMLNYIYSLNSSGIIPGVFEIVAPPASSVIEIEKELGVRGRYYGLLFGSWKMETKDNSISHLISIFDGQAFRDDFLVKNIEIKLGTVSISGDFVCKTGS